MLVYCRDMEFEAQPHIHELAISSYGILFLGTPHAGSDIAKWGVMVQAIASNTLPRRIFDSSPNLLTVLAKGNETLQALDAQFRPFIASRSIHVYFFHEMKPTDFGGMRRFIVDIESAAPDIEYTERAGIWADHTSMCRFRTVLSPGYSVVVDAIIRYATEAPTVIAARWLREARTSRAARRIIAPKGYGFSPLVVAPPDVVPNAFTVGFEKELEELHHGSVEARRAWAPAAVLVCGVAGAGKTHLVREYIMRHKYSYPAGIFWVDAKSRASIYNSYWDIAEEIFAHEIESVDLNWRNPSDYVSSVNKWLSRNQDWLMIFDGLNLPGNQASALLGFLPQGRNCSIIYTSTSASLSREQQLYEPVGLQMRPLGVGDGCSLLFHVLDTKDPTYSQIEKARQIVLHYEGLPLAIRAVGHFLLGSGHPLIKYRIPFGLPFPEVVTPFREAKQSLEQCGQHEALALVTLLSFFRHHMPVGLIILGEQGLSEFKIKLRTMEPAIQRHSLDFTIAILIRYGFVQRGLNKYSERDSPRSTPSGLESFNAPDMRIGSSSSSIDVLKIHTVVQSFFKEELAALGKGHVNWWIGVATKVLFASYSAAVQLPVAPKPVKDFREYQSQARHIRTLFPEHPRNAMKKLRAALDRLIDEIEREIENHSPVSSRASLGRHSGNGSGSGSGSGHRRHQAQMRSVFDTSGSFASSSTSSGLESDSNDNDMTESEAKVVNDTSNPLTDVDIGSFPWPATPPQFPEFHRLSWLETESEADANERSNLPLQQVSRAHDGAIRNIDDERLLRGKEGEQRRSNESTHRRNSSRPLSPTSMRLSISRCRSPLVTMKPQLETQMQLELCGPARTAVKKVDEESPLVFRDAGSRDSGCQLLDDQDSDHRLDTRTNEQECEDEDRQEYDEYEDAGNSGSNGDESSSSCSPRTSWGCDKPQMPRSMLNPDPNSPDCPKPLKPLIYPDVDVSIAPTTSPLHVEHSPSHNRNSNRNANNRIRGSRRNRNKIGQQRPRPLARALPRLLHHLSSRPKTGRVEGKYGGNSQAYKSGAMSFPISDATDSSIPVAVGRPSVPVSAFHAPDMASSLPPKFYRSTIMDVSKGNNAKSIGISGQLPSPSSLSPHTAGSIEQTQKRTSGKRTGLGGSRCLLRRFMRHLFGDRRRGGGNKGKDKDR